MIKAVIVDDEVVASNNLHKLLDLYCKEDVAVTGIASSVESAVDLITSLQPDLVFLDVHLAQDISFAILDAFPVIPFSIIFVSGYANYAVNAFKVDAIDYLLKPIDSDELISAIAKYKTRSTRTTAASGAEFSIRVHHGDTVSFVASSGIIALTADDNYTCLIAANGKKYTASKTLGELENTLEPLSSFIRIHRGVIINKQFVETYSKTQPFSITLTNGLEFEVSRRKRAEVIALLTSH